MQQNVHGSHGAVLHDLWSRTDSESLAKFTLRHKNIVKIKVGYQIISAYMCGKFKMLK
jgi:hypothetical protein